MLAKVFKPVLLASVATGGVVLISEDDKRSRELYRLGHSVYRIANLVSTVALIGGDYAWHLNVSHRHNTDNNSLIDTKHDLLQRIQTDQELVTIRMMKSNDPVEIQQCREKIVANRQLMDQVTEDIATLHATNRTHFIDIHRRNAIRLRNMCANNGGLYIKLGQHLAMLDHVVPREYQETLTTLLANTPTSSAKSVQRVFQEDIGLSPNDLFDEFHTIPIASASLAQVHLAIKDGVKYAVKIQHEGLREGSAVDRLVITKLVDWMNLIFPSFKYQFLTKEMNLNLPLELDFQTERGNLLQATKNLKSFIETGDVAIPVPVEHLCSSRILTMTFEEGVYVSQVEEVARKHHIKPLDVSRLISQVFCEQIFRHGFVHCDPHDANLLVRAHPTRPGKPQLVLLDHGLYRQLDDDFRRNYARLWQAMILCDEVEIEEYCRKLHAGELYTLLAAMLTLRPWDDIVSKDVEKLNATHSKADKVMLQSYARKYYHEIVELLAIVPSDLLLLLKTNDCLRHLDKVMHTPVNSTAVVGEVCSVVILQEDLTDILTTNSHTGWYDVYRQWFSAWDKYVQVRSRVQALSYLTYVWGCVEYWQDSKWFGGSSSVNK